MSNGETFLAFKRCLGTQSQVDDALKALHDAHDIDAITDDQFLHQKWLLAGAHAFLNVASDYYLLNCRLY